MSTNHPASLDKRIREHFAHFPPRTFVDASIWLDHDMFAELLASLGTSKPRLLRWAGFIYWVAPSMSGSRIVLRPDSLKTFAVRLQHT